MTSMRGRGRGARGSPVAGDSIRRGSWRGGPPGSAGYASRGAANSNTNSGRDNKSDDKVGKGALPDKPRGFQTDTDISAGSRHAERELKPWTAEADHATNGAASTAGAGTAQAVRDALTFGMGSSSVPWDQFETNARLFGAKTDYDEEIYTTKLDRSTADYKKRERHADRIASEILSKTSSNPHIAEERNNAAAGDGKDEEEKYSGVVRSQGAYVPPGARRAAGGVGPAGAKVSPKESPKGSPKESPTSKEAAKEIPKEAAPAATKSNGAPATTIVPLPNQLTAIPTPPAIVTGPSSSPSPAPPLVTRLSADAAVIDPAIASLGPSPSPVALSMARSTSSVPPQPANADRDTVSATTPMSKAPIGAVLDQARQFVESERERATARKQSMAKNERAHVLADLKSWQAKFKVPLPIPKDILPILSKDEQKQKEIEARAEKSLHEAQDRKKVTVVLKSPAVSPSSATVLSPEPGKSTGPKRIPMKIPEIPPFRKKVPPSVPVPESAAQHITLITSPTPSNASVHSGAAAAHAAKLNPNASAFVFKPNPSAAAFQPASSVNSPASTSAKLPAAPAGPSTAASTSASASTSSAAPKNPFYRDGPPKRITVDPRNDFSPFKHAQVPTATTIPLQWPYTGRRSSVAFGNMPVHPMANMQPGSFEGEDPSSPHAGPPAMLQGVPPNLYPIYRYQPGMPPVQGGMMPPMFSPGPGFMPGPQMGSPHLGQPPQQGPNGMPMYFAANGMPPNAHFIPQLMHFHPNGPGRPGPGGPMFYPNQQMQGHQAPQMQPQMSYSGQPTPPQPHFQQALPPQGGPGGPPPAYEAAPAQ